MVKVNTAIVCIRYSDFAWEGKFILKRERESEREGGREGGRGRERERERESAAVTTTTRKQLRYSD